MIYVSQQSKDNLMHLPSIFTDLQKDFDTKLYPNLKMLKCFFILINNFIQNVPSIIHCVYKNCFLIANNPNIKKT